MHVPSSYIKRKACLAIIPVILLMLAGSPCAAQNANRLPDSLNTEVDSIPVKTSYGDIVAPPGASAALDRTKAIIDSAPVGQPDSSPRSDSPSQDTGTSTTIPDSLILRQVPGAVTAANKKEKDFEYANDPAYWTRERVKPFKENAFLAFLDKLFSGDAFRFLLYALLAGGLVFALYKIIAGNNMHLFYRSPKKVSDGTDPDDEINLDEEDLEKKIQESLNAGDHRTATRYLFLKTLRLLKDRELIAWHARATNEEYISQMKAHPQGEKFRFLAGAYEHIWYGNFLLNEEQSAWLVNYFRDFYKAIATK